jgi:DNA-binding response OmpR family regulator
MSGKIFLVVLNPIEAEQIRARLDQQGWEVNMETEDHGRAYDFLLRERPDLLLIDLDHHPAAARKVARSIRAVKGFSSLPVVYIAGQPEERELARAEVDGAVFTTHNELPRVLQQFKL